MGYSFPSDRGWTITTPDFAGELREYNHEITAYDHRFKVLDPSFHYGGNAYYVLWTLAPSKGWTVKAIEDGP